MKYYKYKIENLIKITEIVTVHYFDFDKDFVSDTESHDFWEMVYAERGDLICFNSGKKTVLRQGEALFHKPMEEHSLKSNGKTSTKVIIVSFVSRSEALSFFTAKTVKLKKETQRLLYSIVNEAKKTFDLPYSDPALKKMPLSEKPALGGLQLIKNYAEILLITLIRDETDVNGENKVFVLPKSPDKISGKISEILSEGGANVKIDDLAGSLGYSKSYLFKVFKLETGTTINSFKKTVLVNRAQSLLAKTDLSVTEIAEKLGFDTQSYFTKFFTLNARVTPTEYRKIHRA